MRYPFDQRLAFRRDDNLKQYWKALLRLHHVEMYKGVRMAKLPTDLRTYEHVIEQTRPEVIVELGAGTSGGSSVWFADRLDIFSGGGRVVAVEIAGTPGPESPVHEDKRVTWIEGNLGAKSVISRVKRLTKGKRTMVVEDSAHNYETTLAALQAYSPMVTKGQFFVVEDTIVDDPEVSIFGDFGVTNGIDMFLSENDRFLRRTDLDLYGITMHSGGWLECVK